MSPLAFYPSDRWCDVWLFGSDGMSWHGRLLKLREEADPFSMDIGVVGPGDIVKVIEVSERVSCQGL